MARNQRRNQRSANQKNDQENKLGLYCALLQHVQQVATFVVIAFFLAVVAFSVVTEIPVSAIFDNLVKSFEYISKETDE